MPRRGGFGQAPKFPTPHKIFFLQALQVRFQSEPAQVMARKTLDAMALGGLFDPITGGFARYATDRDWLIPHFEKMLIDNALLAIAYLRQYQLEKSPGDRYVADRTLAYMANRLSSPGEAFYSAQDADALGQEGAYYALTFQDLREALGPARAEDFAAAYGFTDEGNFQGTNIPNQLHRQKLEAPDPSFLADFKKLDAYRQARMPLHRDEKILLGWNALAIYAFVVAFEVTGEPSYLDLAQAKRQLLEDKMRRPDGAYVRAERQGKQSGLAQLGDLASLARLDLALYRVGGQGRQLRSALALLESIQEDFYDAQGAGYYMTSARVADLIIRPKEWLDGAHMSANALMVGLLHEAWLLTGFASYRDQLDALLDAFKEIPGLSAVTHAHFFFELAWVMAPSRSLVTTARPEALLPWQTSLQDPSLYRRTLLRLDQDSREVFKDRPSFVHAISDAVDQWMLCQDSSCQRPVASFADLQD